MSCCSIIQNPIDQLRTVTKIFTRKFVITRHMCHRLIYLFVTVIFAVAACTITFFIKMYLLLPFIILLWWLWTFCNYVIFISTSKEIRGVRSVRLLSKASTARDFSFSCLFFLIFFCKVINTSTKNILFLNSVYALTIYNTT